MMTTCFDILEVEILEESYTLDSKRFRQVVMARNNPFPRVFYLWERWKSVFLSIHI